MKYTKPTVVIVMPELGLTTGEMPHVRFPPKNYMPSQALYFLYTACRNLGYFTHVVDANWSKAPTSRILFFQPSKIFITTATPTLTGTLKIIRELKQAGYSGEIYVGGPHVSLNFLLRDFLLADLTAEEEVTLLPTIKSTSTFDWVPIAFPGRSPFEVLGMNTEAAQDYLKTEFERENGRKMAGRLEAYIFSYFKPTMAWMEETYSGSHVKEEWKNIPIRYSIITSIGCSKTCSFCGNPYIYRIGFKSPRIVREILEEYVAHGIDRISVHDMYFLMYKPHALEMMKIFRESEVQYSMQTCLDDLTEEWLEDLKDSGLQKFLVGIENPTSYTVGKKVEIEKVSWLLKVVKEKELEGVKLSYIVGLPGVSIENDFALLQHIISEVTSHGHPLYDLQVNLYTPYRPEPKMLYLPYQKEQVMEENMVRLLTKLPFKYWGSFPVGFNSQEEFNRQMILCDVVFAIIYPDFVAEYLARRECYIQEIRHHYPELYSQLPSYEQSLALYQQITQTTMRTKLVA